jgi:nicotinamidase-related amidase
MTEKIWDQYLGEQDKKVLERGRFARRMGFGKNPAIIVVDAQKYMVGELGKESEWPSSSGEPGRKAMEQIVALVSHGQKRSIPVFFTRFEIDPSGKDMGVYARKRDLLKTPHWCLSGEIGAELVSDLIPNDQDIVFVKKKPSCFHGTPLLGYLIDRQIDTVIVVGGSTSNCVRATVFDAASYNYRVIIPQEAVFDRFPISNAISLFDMDRQFADVVSIQEVFNYFDLINNG